MILDIQKSKAVGLFQVPKDSIGTGVCADFHIVGDTVAFAASIMLRHVRGVV